MFQLKDFVSIAASMINRAKATQDRITDFNVGSVARTIMESPAIEIEELYQRMFAGILDAVPASIYRGFNFTVLDATAARGVVLLGFTEAIEVAFTIPAGTIFVAPASGYRFVSVADVVVPHDATTAAVLVESEGTGAAYNLGAGLIQAVNGYTLPSGTLITNEAITSGRDAESDADRKARFAAYVVSLSRCTNGAVRFAAMSALLRNPAGDVVEYVSRVGIVESAGMVDVYIYGSGEPPSMDLVAEAQKLIDGYWDDAAQAFVPGYRPIGVRVLVRPMTEQAFDIAITVAMRPGVNFSTDTQNSIRTSLAALLSNLAAGDTLFVDHVVAAVLRVDGVRTARVNLAENYVCPANVVLIPGVVQIVEGN